MLLKTDSLSGGFEQFAAIEELPTHNQQVRMLAGANVKTQQRATRSMLELAKGRLCHIDCVGVLEEMDSRVMMYVANGVTSPKWRAIVTTTAG